MNKEFFSIKDSKIIDVSVSGETFNANGNPNLVFNTKEPFTYCTTWKITGILPRAINGTFQVDAYAEAMGTNPDAILGSYSEPVDITSTSYELKASIVVPSATILSLQGPYKLFAILTHMDDHKVPTPFFVFYEGPMVQFIK